MAVSNSSAQTDFPYSDAVSSVRVSEETVGEHACWKIKYVTFREGEGEVPVICELYLAKSRMLLPVKQVFRSGFGRILSEVRTTRLREMEFEPSSELWLPRMATTTIRSGASSKINVLMTEFESLAPESDDFYSQVKPVSPRHMKPKNVVPKSYAAKPILTAPLVTNLVFQRFAGQLEFRTAGGGLLALLIVVVGIPFSMKRTRLGRVCRHFFARQRWIIVSIWIVLITTVTLLSSYPPGWLTYGITMMVAGIFAFCWMCFSFFLLGEWKVSIRTTLVAAACLAIFSPDTHKDQNAPRLGRT